MTSAEVSKLTPAIDSALASPKKTQYKLRLNWPNIIFFSVVHAIGIYGLFLAITSAKWQTLLWTWFLKELTFLGNTAGVHRLWAHRCYKAKWPLQVLLMLFFTLGHQKSIYKWVRDHRVHHRYTDSDIDPHNIRRGFFYSHIGWLLTKKLPPTIEKGQMEDLSDLKANPVVMFQHRHYYKLVPIVSAFIPTIIPMYAWNESFVNSFCIAAILRYLWSLHLTFCINSVAHTWGSKPYDKSILAVNNKFVFFNTMGEGWHNFHHVFPWDYRTLELGSSKLNINLTTYFIDFMAKIGQISDRKMAPSHLIEKRMARTGDLDLNSHKEVEEAGNVAIR